MPLLRRSAGLLALLLLGRVAAAGEPAPEPRTEVFTGAGQEQRASERPSTTTTAYWRIDAYVRVAEANPGSRVEMLLPLSDGRQRILSRRVVGDGFGFREEGDGPNLRGVWTRTGPAAAAEVQYELTAEISDEQVSIPRKTRAAGRRGQRDGLAPSPLVQSDDPEIRRQAHELTKDTNGTDAAVWALFQFVSTRIRNGEGEPRADAKQVLRAGVGNSTGKARLMAALLRSLDIPARIMGGVRLQDASKKRATISWVEADFGEGWVPLDPGGNHMGWLPNDYLAIYRGDLPLIVHTAGLEVDYGFIVRQATREVALGRERSQPAAADSAVPRVETRVGAQEVRAVTSYQDKPVASVLMLVDQSVPENVSERVLREARGDEVSIVMLQSSFESRYFREQHLQRLVSNNLSLVSGAHLVLVSTGDDAGLYALFALGERGVSLGDARIVIAGNFPQAVGNVLGTVLLRLVGAGEIVLVNRPAGVLPLWEMARANLLRGVPMLEEARKWDLHTIAVNAGTVRQLGSWRNLVVEAWVSAVRAQVPLQALNLILILPIIATIIVVARIVIGIDSFGTFAPVIVSLAFLTTGLQWGVIIFTAIVSCGALVRVFLQRLRLQLVSRLAILIATVAGVMAGLTVLGAWVGVGALINISIFPMVIMSSVIENFAASQFEFGTREAARLAFNTLVLACICYSAIEFSGLQAIALAYPEIVLVSVLLNVLLGKWRGLRILEYLRFSSLARQRPAT